MATTAKENILKKIREALSNPVPLPFPHSEGTQTVFKESDEDPVVVFAEEFTALQGKFIFCADEQELLSQLSALIRERGWDKIFCLENKILPLLEAAAIPVYDDLASCDVSLTGCEFLVARTGTIVLSAAQQSGRTVSVYAPVHICIATSAQVVNDVKDALTGLKERYGNTIPSFITFASGPSRTADIEKTLVTGVHGPKEVFCFMIDKKNSR